MGRQKQGLAQSFTPGIFLVALAMLAVADCRAASQAMTEDDLRHASARGWPDNLFKTSVYAADGNVIEMFGDAGRFLNPLGSLLEADTGFRDVVYNPADPSIVTDRDGSTMIRLPATIGEISLRNIRVKGSNGASFGSVTIRNIDLRGTVIKISKH